ncbi:MAG: helix-turn-helix domain-containing protein [Elusimicrobia bacterium]|jgi:transcriptional regulator with XRE-family HTH domain|nr:helix-turn-helix domain-containing protein [Elusimicrobiota bacterium]
MNNHFNSEVKKGLKDKGISMRELARKSGLDVSFLSKILSGRRNPPRKEKAINKIARALDIREERLVFAAGRIPKKLIPVFKDVRTIDRLLSGKLQSGKEKGSQVAQLDVAAKKKKNKRINQDIKKSPLGVGRLEDTLL